MKKYFILFLFLILMTGCTKKEVTEIKKEKTKEEKPIGIKNTYNDSNNTPISIYHLEGNTLSKLTESEEELIPMQDIGIFQIYPSTEDTIKLNSFANDFYNEWMKYNTNNNLKIGFNISYDLDTNEHISYNVLSPSNNFDHCEYLMNYLYDDYANQNKGFYSHIEEKDLNESTLFTSIKLQSSGDINKITNKIELTVFTYDSEDDFINDQYRGNSKYTYTIKKK